MIYVKLCRNYVEADYLLRKFAKKHHNEVKRLRRIYRSMCAILNNGDEYHFVPESKYEEWQIGRRGFEEVKQYAEDE